MRGWAGRWEGALRAWVSGGPFGPTQACSESKGLGFDLPGSVADTSSGGSVGLRVRRRGVFPSAPAWFQGGYFPRWRRFGLNLTCPRERRGAGGCCRGRCVFLGVCFRGPRRLGPGVGSAPADAGGASNGRRLRVVGGWTGCFRPRPYVRPRHPEGRPVSAAATGLRLV